MNHGWHYPYYRRGPSRIIWFILGGVAASWWMIRKEAHAAYGHIGYCVRKPIQASPSDQPQELPASLPDERTPMSIPQTPNGKYAAWGFGQTPPFGWEEEKDRMLALGRQAGDTVCL
jgi:hypothetical protein